MRLLLLGAFPYPHAQGSQVYFQEQAIALRAAGADVELLTYASGLPPCPDTPRRWRALDGFVHHRSPSWSAPETLRSGPSWAKPLADLGLARALHDAVASKLLQSGGYDAILTHHTEAALVAQTLSLSPGHSAPPTVYCVHTLLENELPYYFKRLKEQDYLDQPPQPGRAGERLARTLRRGVERLGRSLDRRAVRGASGWISLTQSVERVMRQAHDAPSALIAPPIPDPQLAPDRLDPDRTARRFGLEPGDFYLYSGNLDGYQELELLARVGASRPSGRDRPEIVIASHDPEIRSAQRLRRGRLRLLRVPSEAEMQALLGAARASLVPRRVPGGFPIKLANSLAVGTAPVCFLEQEWGLADGVDALVVRAARGESGDRALAAALDTLDRAPELARRLGAGARVLYEARHRPDAVAGRTLELIEQARQSAAGIRRGS